MEVTLGQQIQVLNMLQSQLVRNFLEGESRISEEGKQIVFLAPFSVNAGQNAEFGEKRPAQIIRIPSQNPAMFLQGIPMFPIRIQTLAQLCGRRSRRAFLRKKMPKQRSGGKIRTQMIRRKRAFRKSGYAAEHIPKFINIG